MTQHPSRPTPRADESDDTAVTIDPLDPKSLRTQAFHVLAQARSALDRRIASELLRWGIGTVHFQMLGFIFRHGRCTPSQCAYELYMSGSTVTHLIGQLEKKDLLVPQTKGSARREFVLRLSSKGASTYRQASKTLSNGDRGAGRSSAIQELAALDVALRKLADVLRD
ncbi:hypothetical protein [Pseudomonas baltica]|uniref:MarR family winged helix-turn-helix transcriptional regulator n=1 Tax=Pseudomonas baltica TaxID=2762576 RepID=UPI00289CAFF3|nr:hypothetical protein [Pseudomonas baltica]